MAYDYQLIDVAITGGIATVTINRPERRNAMTQVMNRLFHRRIRDCLLYTSPSPRDPH